MDMRIEDFAPRYSAYVYSKTKMQSPTMSRCLDIMDALKETELYRDNSSFAEGVDELDIFFCENPDALQAIDEALEKEYEEKMKKRRKQKMKQSRYKLRNIWRKIS